MPIARLIVAALALIFINAAAAQDAPPTERTLRIGAKVAEPFVIQDGEELSGISIELWERIADELDLEYQIEVVSLDEMIDGVETGEFDVAVGAISVTTEREEKFDLSHGYHISGLGIAVPAGSSERPWMTALRRLLSGPFITAVGGLATLLLVVGVLMWVVERRSNTEEFNPGVVRGIGDGFWFSAVTMTTVGYGDKAPRSLPGRILALIWMFGSIIIISAFTGAIASSLTAAQIETGVAGVNDLREARVGALTGAASNASVRNRGVTPRAYDTVKDGLDALAGGEIDAFVHDRPILQFAIRNDHAGELRMLDAQFDISAYAIATPQGSPLLEPINREILAITRDRAWSDVLARYLGAE